MSISIAKVGYTSYGEGCELLFAQQLWPKGEPAMASYHNAKPTTGWKAVIEFFKPLVWWIEPVLLMIRIIPEFFEFPENVPLLMCAEGFLLLTFIAFLIAGVLTFVGNVFLLVGKVTVWLFGLPFEAGRYANETMGRSHSWLD